MLVVEVGAVPVTRVLTVWEQQHWCESLALQVRELPRSQHHLSQKGAHRAGAQHGDGVLFCLVLNLSVFVEVS